MCNLVRQFLPAIYFKLLLAINWTVRSDIGFKGRHNSNIYSFSNENDALSTMMNS